MIVVFGSLNFDLVFGMDRLPVGGETRLAQRFTAAPGGKGANQAVAAARDGADVHMVGWVGDDIFGDKLIASLREVGVTCAIGRTDQPTGCASVCVDAVGENAIAVAPGANLVLRAEDVPDHLLDQKTTLVMQMEVTIEENWALLRRAKRMRSRTLLNVAPAAPVPAEALDLVDVLIVNRGELEVLARGLGMAADGHEAFARSIAARHGLACLVTLGAKGVFAATAHQVYRLPAFPVAAVDTVGAGDTFCGVLAASLDRGTALEGALRRGTVAAALACTKHGAQPSIPAAHETAAALSRDDRTLQRS